jgi:hypothetical protein
VTDTPMGDHLPLNAFEVLELPRRRAPALLKAFATIGVLAVAIFSILGICIMVGA